MSFEPFKTVTSRTCVVSERDIDTDQIIPARFLTTTSASGLGEAAFYDWRYDNNGVKRNMNPLSPVEQGGHEVLVAGGNFGCGSSREHAPWALLGLGLRVIISSDIADIFKSNSLKNGLLPVEVDTATHEKLLANPDMEVSVDLETETLTMSDGSTASFTIEPFARRCLLDGVDQLGFLLSRENAIADYEARKEKETA